MCYGDDDEDEDDGTAICDPDVTCDTPCPEDPNEPCYPPCDPNAWCNLELGSMDDCEAYGDCD